MNGRDFFQCVTTIVGPGNAERYATKFGDLDGLLSEDNGILNYEGLAFYVYTTSLSWHYKINAELWGENPSYCVLMFREVMNKTLEKLVIYKNNGGLIYRGYKAANLEEFLTRYEVGKLVHFPGFTSAAFKEENAFGGNVFFMIRSLTARSVWFLAADFMETEVLIAAGKDFLVVDKTADQGRAVITLEEQP